MFEQSVKGLPLQGRRILITRTKEQAGAFSAQLSALGAIPVVFPTICVVAPEDWKPLDQSLKRLCETNWYDWLIFTSANGVRICFERLIELGYRASDIGDVRIAAIGPATATALIKYGINVSILPAKYIAEDVASTLIEDAQKRGEVLDGKRVLLPRAAEARDVLINELQKAGIIVDVVAVYQTVGVNKADKRGHQILRQLETQQLDILTFTSSSTVKNFMHWLTENDATFADRFMSSVKQYKRPKIASIGPITSQSAHEIGLDIHIEARVFTTAGLLEAIIRSEENS
jgi:uroporphyrinogen-III synthase